jgi:TRAP-type C4-dicarboxylate transport system permease small subunit
MLRLLDLVMGAVAVVLVAATAIITCLAVFFRYVLNAALPWPEEVAGYLLVWISFAGAYVGLRRGSHISFGALVDKMPSQSALAVRAAVDLMLAALFLFLLIYSVRMIQTLGSDRLVSAEIPQWVFMLSMPVFAACALLHLAAKWWSRWRGELR